MSKFYPIGFALPWLLAAMPLFTFQSAYAGWAAAGIFAAIALLELLLPKAMHNVAESDERAVGTSAWYKLILRGYLPLQLLLMGVMIGHAASMSVVQLLGAAAALGLVTGSIGITFAHELGHRRSLSDRLLAHGLMGAVGYGQFMIEHYRGHHTRVCTPDDPATARLGESLYAFVLRTVRGQFLSAWRLERDRLSTAWSIRNVLLWHVALAAAIPIVLFQTLGTNAAWLWIGQALVAIWQLESVNYIEHYGLQRKRLADGSYEPVGPLHAWNTYARPSNWLLVHLQRHADHHMLQGRPFQLLRAFAPCNELPTGYAGCIMLAMVPPLWFRVIHKRLAAAPAAVRCAAQV
jgi:alkane 1-monooxygenase